MGYMLPASDIQIGKPHTELEDDSFIQKPRHRIGLARNGRMLNCGAAVDYRGGTLDVINRRPRNACFLRVQERLFDSFSPGLDFLCNSRRDEGSADQVQGQTLAYQPWVRQDR